MGFQKIEKMVEFGLDRLGKQGTPLKKATTCSIIYATLNGCFKVLQYLLQKKVQLKPRPQQALQA